MGRYSLWLPLGLLLFLAGVSAWLNYTVQNSGNADALHETDPESIIENVRAVRTDIQGRVKESLSARRLSHFSGTDVSELEAPHLVQFTPGRADLGIVAEHATVAHDDSRIVLDRNVVVTRSASAGEGAMVLRTERLLAFPQQNLLRAPGAVSVVGSGLNLNANGLVADTAKRTLKLSDRVHARYLATENPHAHAKP